MLLDTGSLKERYAAVGHRLEEINQGCWKGTVMRRLEVLLEDWPYGKQHETASPTSHFLT